MLTSLFSLFYVTGESNRSYTEDEPKLLPNYKRITTTKITLLRKDA